MNSPRDLEGLQLMRPEWRLLSSANLRPALASRHGADNQGAAEPQGHTDESGAPAGSRPLWVGPHMQPTGRRPWSTTRARELRALGKWNENLCGR
jgi:hypothetical protein